MIWFLLLLYASIAVALAAFGHRLGRHAFTVAVVPAGATTAWSVLGLGGDEPVTADLVWVAGLDLSLTFSVGPLAALMSLIVAGIGVGVFVYSAGYFAADAPGLGRFAATLVAFSGAMVGLVWADSIWTLFIFWELTSITSFLLVGHKHADPDVRVAARRALLVTASGGLSLLAGFVLVADVTGTSRLSEMSAAAGTSAAVAAVLVMVAAATKSAQVPFHVWLPGAMAAPTPVSAYLHSATMVKAGVLLVALGSPVFVDQPLWKVMGLSLGLTSMIWGARGALRHVDAKLILAWGTISQLGLMIALLSVGTGKAMFAAVSILLAHAVFKAALFMVVGEIDVRTGTRDIRELSGLWRSMPLATAVAVVSGASMAGLPPLLGFPAKEAAIEAVLGLSGAEAWVGGGVVIIGSVLTVAYTLRLLLGLFTGTGSPTPVARGRVRMTVPSVTLGLLSVAGFFFLGTVSEVVRSAATQVNAKAEVYDLVRWPGPTEALGVSMVVVAIGVLAGLVSHRRTEPAPAPMGAAVVDHLTDGTLVVARLITGRVQHGSLPVYLTTMAATAALATAPFLLALDRDVLHAWDSPVQAVLAVLVVAAALTATTVGSRLGAALSLGAVGIGVSGLFLVQGAPDLALTQLLVETVVVVGFVIGLGQLARRFPPVGSVWRGIRIGVAGLVGAGVAIGLAATATGPERPPLPLREASVEEGGGNNIVNVILTDIRALDTLGEIVVLVVVAAGVMALARAGRHRADPPLGEELA
ncbi:MAG: proton-conducting transporter membrane subunit [Acidimicrobiia bacterium]|nr:proton-conducting transporter membrane subunit [Acidimicrobiia bacterium]